MVPLVSGSRSYTRTGGEQVGGERPRPRLDGGVDGRSSSRPSGTSPQTTALPVGLTDGFLSKAVSLVRRIPVAVFTSQRPISDWFGGRR